MYNENISTGHVHNNTCIGRVLWTDTKEEPDDQSNHIRFLKYLPIAIWVQPNKINIDLKINNAPTCCIPVIPRETESFNLILTQALPNGKKSINIHRTGMGLDQVQVVYTRHKA
jgi:hypothetical protein